MSEASVSDQDTETDRTPDDPAPIVGWIALAGGLLPIALLAAPMAFGYFYTSNDLAFFHIPLRVFYAQCLASGDDPSSLPGYFCGFDLHGEGQIGLFHPVHLLLYGILPVSLALPIEFLLCYLFLFVGTVLFLRRWVTLAGAAAGALIATYFGYAMQHFTHINSVAVLAHLPWALLFFDLMLRGPGTGRVMANAGAALALVVASAMLLGHPQTAWYIGLVGLPYTLAVASWERRGKRLLLASGFVVVGTLLGAVQLLPTWDAMNRSTRATLEETAVLSGSLHPLNVTQLVAPYGLQRCYIPTEGGTGVNKHIGIYELGLYPGMAVAPLLVWLLLRWRDLSRSQRRLAGAGLVLAIVGLVVATGSYGPAESLLTNLPLVKQFRRPARYGLLTQMGLAAAVAVAVDDLVRRRPPDRISNQPSRLAWLAAIPLLTIACLLLLAVANRRSPGTIGELASPLRISFTLLYSVAAAGLVALAALRPRLGLLGLLLFTLFDFALYHLRPLYTVDATSIQAVISPQPSYPPLITGTRLFTFPSLPKTVPVSGKLLMEGAKLATGYVAMMPSRRLSLEPASDDVLRLLGVSWAWNGGDRWNPPTSYLPDDWRAIDNPAPRARAVARTVASTTPPKIPDGFDLHTTAIVDQPVALDPGDPGQVTLVQDRPGQIEVTVETPGRRLVVLNEAYHPGWVAPLDGAPTAVQPADYDFMGVVVPTGKHQVAFRFRPPSFRHGAILSLTSLAALSVLWLVVRRRDSW